MNEDTWIGVIEGFFGPENTIEREDLMYESENQDFQYWSFRVLDSSGDERDFDYIKNSSTGKIGVTGYSEFYNPDIIAAAYPEEDPNDIKAISELLRGYEFNSVDILKINNQTPERYVELDCLKVVEAALIFYEIKVVRKDDVDFCLEFSDSKFKSQDTIWDGGEGDVDLNEYQFKGNDFSLKDFPAHGFADGGEGDIDLNEYQFTDNSYADFVGTNG